MILILKTFLFIIYMSLTVSEKLDANRLPKKPFGLKSKQIINWITLNPSSANPGEKLFNNYSMRPRWI